MAGRYGRRLLKDEDFEEGELWGSSTTTTEERENSSPRLRNSIKKNSSSVSPSSATTKPRMIPRSSPSSIEAPKQFSAPLDIPDWSKIYGKSTSNKKSSGTTNYNLATHSSSSSWVVHHHQHDYLGYDQGHDHGDEHEDEDADDEAGKVPPHEYLARKLARSQISSFSVYEGIGRTLKGRDLSKVRNAILTKTGFLE